MSSFGATLKRERESKGISLQEISARTKIGVRLLKALEEEQLDLLPGGIFNKSFVRQYARFLGLDEDQVLSEYSRAVGAVPEPQPPLVPPSPEKNFLPPPDSGPSQTGAYVRLILTAALLGAIVAGGFYVVRQFQAKRAARAMAAQMKTAAPPAAPLAQSIAPPASGDLAGTSPAGSPASVLPGSAPLSTGVDAGATPPAGQMVGPSAPAATAERNLPPLPSVTTGQNPPAVGAANKTTATATDGSAGTLVLNIEARRECWISITADGQKEFQGNLEADRSRRVQARDSFRLTIGDAGAVTLILNGKSLPAIGRSGEVKTVAITAKGLTQPEP